MTLMMPMAELIEMPETAEMSNAVIIEEETREEFRTIIALPFLDRQITAKGLLFDVVRVRQFDGEYRILGRLK